MSAPYARRDNVERLVDRMRSLADRLENVAQAEGLDPTDQRAAGDLERDLGFVADETHHLHCDLRTGPRA